MKLIFPQASKKFAKWFSEFIQAGVANTYLDSMLAAYDLTEIDEIILILLKGEWANIWLRDHFQELGLSVKVTIVELDNETSGSICSLLMAVDEIGNGAVAISALDQVAGVKRFAPVSMLSASGASVVVPMTHSEDQSFCFLLRDEDGEPLQFFEKKAVSREAVVGIYIFREFREFFEGSCRLLLKFKGFQERQFFSSDVLNELLCSSASICTTFFIEDAIKVRNLTEFMEAQ